MQGKITNALLPVAERYNNNLDQQQRYEFRRQIRSFVKWYNYITQIVRMFDKDLHKEYIFCSYLSRLLPSDEKEVWDLGNKVALEYYKLEETFAGSISLEKDRSGQYETPTMKKGATKQESKSQLEEVIEKFNEHYAGEITEGDRILAEILMTRCLRMMCCESLPGRMESKFSSTVCFLKPMTKPQWMLTRRVARHSAFCSVIQRNMLL
ncbi:MAG: hypothetical protein ACLSB9_22485 [Hydrogeniiclostridium mannosilyticum]